MGGRRQAARVEAEGWVGRDGRTERRRAGGRTTEGGAGR